MKKCGYECPVICDFCKYFEEHWEVIDGQDTDEPNEHMCTLHNRPTDFQDWCEDFYCTLADDPKRFYRSY